MGLADRIFARTFTRAHTRVVLVLLALALAAAAFDAAGLWRADRADARMVSGQVMADAPGPAPKLPELPELRFAEAYALAASGVRDQALNRYRALQNDPRLGAAARFNSANLLVRQAIEVRASAQPGQSIALLELAKAYYRDVLRADPSQWDARYNLERAQRLLPDADEDDAAASPQAQNRERAVTTMRGHSPGLP